MFTRSVFQTQTTNQANAIFRFLDNLLKHPDKKGAFEPEIVKMRDTILTDNLKSKIVGLYALGLTLRDIPNHIKEIYDTESSATTLS